MPVVQGAVSVIEFVQVFNQQITPMRRVTHQCSTFGSPLVYLATFEFAFAPNAVPHVIDRSGGAPQRDRRGNGRRAGLVQVHAPDFNAMKGLKPVWRSPRSSQRMVTGADAHPALDKSHCALRAIWLASAIVRASRHRVASGRCTSSAVRGSAHQPHGLN